jgi:hypothetical protein
MPFCWRIAREEGCCFLVVDFSCLTYFQGLAAPFSKILTKDDARERKFSSPIATEKYIIYFAHERSHIYKKRERERERERERGRERGKIRRYR